MRSTSRQPTGILPSSSAPPHRTLSGSCMDARTFRARGRSPPFSSSRPSGTLSGSSAALSFTTRPMAARRFSQAISEGDGISVLVDVHDAASARAAEAQGAEALVVRGAVDPVRAATELPILCRAPGPLAQAARDGADACLIVVEDHEEDGDRLERLYAEATELALDCVVEVRDDEELELALERLDPEIFLLARARDDGEDAVDQALD